MLSLGLPSTGLVLVTVAGLRQPRALLGLLTPHVPADYQHALAVGGGVFLTLCLGALGTASG